MCEPTADQGPPEAEQLVESLLGEALLAADPERALAAAMERHPEQAAALRRSFAILSRAGLVGRGPTEPGGWFGRFRLLAPLGGGGMGEVHLAEESPLGRRVALKRIRPEWLHVAESRARFLREVAAVAALQHPHIVPIFSYGELDGVPYYVMQHVEGRSLAAVLAAAREQGEPGADLLQRTGTDWRRACVEVAAQIADALAHAHGRGILHRDVKPSNVMLASDGRALLIDFGVARIAGDQSLTRSGVQPGSLAYMSPEQVRGEDVDERTDVWSLGVTLLELLTTVAPFAGPTEAETRRRILAGDGSLPSTAGRPIGGDVAVVVATCLAPERERRYASAAALAADLRAILDRRPIAARPPTLWLRCRRFAQRRPTLVAVAVAAVLLFGVVPSAWLLQERAHRERVQREAATAAAAVAFLEELFAETTPERARGDTVTARRILERGAARVRAELADQPAVQASLLEAMGAAFLGLGLLDAAEPLLADADRLRSAVGGTAADRRKSTSLRARLADVRGDPATAAALWEQVVEASPPLRGREGVPRAEASMQLARALWRLDRVDEAEQVMRDGLAFLREHAAGEPARLAAALRERGVFLLEREDPLAAVPVLEEAERLCRGAWPDDHPGSIALAVDLARAHRIVGDHDAAASRLGRAETAAARVLDPQHPLLAAVLEEQAALAIDFDRPHAAAAPLARAIAIHRAVHRSPGHVLARALIDECRLRTALGELRSAEVVAREALDHYERLSPEGHLDMAAALSALSFVHTQAGNLAQAEQLARRSLAMQDRLRQRRTAVRALTTAHLGYALAFGGDFAGAQAQLDEAVAAVDRIRVEPAVALRVRCFAIEVLCLQRRGRDALVALAPLRVAIAGSGPAWQAWAEFLTGWAHEIERDFPAAETALRNALALREQQHGAEHPLCSIVLGQLGVVLANRGALGEAEAVLVRATELRRRHGGERDVHLNLPLLNLATVRMLQRDFEAARRDGEAVFANLDGVAGPGHPVAIGAVRLLLRVTPRVADPAERRRRLLELQRFAAVVVPAGDPLRDAVAAAVAALER